MYEVVIMGTVVASLLSKDEAEKKLEVLRNSPVGESYPKGCIYIKKL